MKQALLQCPNSNYFFRFQLSAFNYKCGGFSVSILVTVIQLTALLMNFMKYSKQTTKYDIGNALTATERRVEVVSTDDVQFITE